MAEKIARVKIKREIGKLYYVKSDEEGWLCIYKADLMRKGRKKVEKGKGKKKEEKKDDQIVV